jgi:hypothetical protein
MAHQNLALLLNLNEDDLLIFIGNELFPKEIQSLNLNPKKIREKAQEWLDSNYTFLKRKLCGNTTLKELIETETLEKSAVLMHIAELIGDIHDSKITVYAIAVYFINFGYKTICSE